MKKSLSYGFKAIRLVWEANGIYSLVMIFGKIYESTLYPFIQVFLLAQVLDLLPKIKDLQTSSFIWIILTYLIASFIKLALRSYLDMREAYFQTELEGFIDLRISKKLTELDPATFEDPEFQNLLSQLEGVKGTLQMHVLRSISLIDAVFKFITATIVVSTSFPLFAPIIVITTIPLYLAVDKARVVTWPYFVEKRSIVTRVTQYIKTLLSSDSTSKESIIYKTGDTLLKKIKDEQKKYYKEFNDVVNPWPFRIFLGRMVQFLAFIYTQYFNFAKIMEGSLSVGQFALLFQQSQNLVFSAEEILSQYSSMSARNKYLDKFFEFLERKSEILNPTNPKALPTATIPQIIEFKSVSFKYPRSERYILKDFNLTIKSGERIALVGENGAGKTTIIKLLLRFYDVTEGEILINGVNIKELDLSEWHKYIGALFQDFIKYQFKFKDNIYLGDLSKTDNEKLLKDAISKSGADKYLDTLPNGIEQIVGKMFEGGVDLSGGQWQKLALARAFFRDAPILILDEPTSAIDAKAEYEIFKNIQNLEKNKTVIIISHRFSTVRHADRILVLDDGKIIEQGTHEKLIALKGLYEELFEIQAKGYK